jgi:antitoxin YefM
MAYSIIVQVKQLLAAGAMIKTTYSEARQNLASLLDRVTSDREIAVIQRRGREDVVLVSADELAGLLETAHLLRSPANARRLLTALRRAQSKKLTPTSLDALRLELGIDGEK